MNWRFWRQPWFWEVVRQVVIALLVALLDIYGEEFQLQPSGGKSGTKNPKTR